MYTGRYAKRKPGLNKGQDCCPCITLHIPLFLYVQLGVYKLLLKIKLWVWHRCLTHPCRSFLPFLAEFPSGIWRLTVSTHFPGLLRPEREGALCLHSLRRPGGHLRPTWTVQVPCLGALLASCVNQGISASFLLYFLHCTIFS